ncbi:UNVERIFIED_CONTAM: hypothetical protein K2H54_002233 [Gekko kuhli]
MATSMVAAVKNERRQENEVTCHYRGAGADHHHSAGNNYSGYHDSRTGANLQGTGNRRRGDPPVHMAPCHRGHFKAETQEMWLLTPGAGSSSKYDQPKKGMPRRSGAENGDWDECLSHIKVGQAKTSCTIEEALMDFLSLVAQTVQGKMRLQHPALALLA